MLYPGSLKYFFSRQAGFLQVCGRHAAQVVKHAAFFSLLASFVWTVLGDVGGSMLRQESLSVGDATVVVLAEMQKCDKEGKARNCYERVARTVIRRFSLPQILAAIEKNEARPEMYNHCHEILHFLGRAVFEKVKNTKEVLAQCTAVCLAGCYHGVIEEYLVEKGLPLEEWEPEKLATELKNICGDQKDYANSEIFHQCIHGVGHAIMFLTEGDLPFSLRICDAFASAPEASLCHTGVFMENANGSTDPSHPSKFTREDDPLYPCNILEESYRAACYSIQSNHFLKITGFDWGKAAILCGKVPVAYRVPCFAGMGSQLVGFIVDVPTMWERCATLPDLKFRTACTRGVSRHLVIRYAGNGSRVFHFCSLVSANVKEPCYDAAGFTLRDWVSDEENFRKRCAEVLEPAYRKVCESARRAQ